MKQPSLAELIDHDKGHVVTMSIKPRSAIGLAGHHADSVIWFDEQGRLGDLDGLRQQHAARG